MQNLNRSDAGVKTCWSEIWNSKTLCFEPFSNAIPRGSHRRQRNFTTERLFLLPFRIGSVIREQRPAAATTRTTVFFESCGVGREISPRRCDGMMQKSFHVTTDLPDGRETYGHHTIQGTRWSSRTRPVNRLQATGEPRRVKRVGSKGYMLGSEGTGQTRTTCVLIHTGKAAAFTKGTEVLSS